MVIDKPQDCYVVGDAVGWQQNGGSGYLATLDGVDLLDDCERINERICEHCPGGNLSIEKPNAIP
jgi:hypothetical protein